MVRSKDILIALTLALTLSACSRSANGNAVPTETGSPPPSRTPTSTEVPTSTETSTELPTLSPTPDLTSSAFATATEQFRNMFEGWSREATDSITLADPIIGKGNLFPLDELGNFKQPNFTTDSFRLYVHGIADALSRGGIPTDQEAFFQMFVGPMNLKDHSLTIKGKSIGWRLEILDAFANYETSQGTNRDPALQIEDVNGEKIPLYSTNVDPDGKPAQMLMGMNVFPEDSSKVGKVRDTLQAFVQRMLGEMIPQERIQGITDAFFRKFLNTIAVEWEIIGDQANLKKVCVFQRQNLNAILASPSTDAIDLRVRGVLQVIDEENASEFGFSTIDALTQLPLPEINGTGPGSFWATLDKNEFHRLIGNRTLVSLSNDEFADIFMKSLRALFLNATRYSDLPAGYMAEAGQVNPPITALITCGGGEQEAATNTPAPEETKGVSTPTATKTPGGSTGTPTPTRTPGVTETPTRLPSNPQEPNSTPAATVASPVPGYTQWASQTPAGDPENTPTPGSAPTSVFETSVPVPTVTPIAP